MINPNPSTIEEILNSSLQFEVPRYQREYTWSKNEALDFLEDLKSYSESTEGSLFLGTIIFDTSKIIDKRIKIVDGQQRLTTIFVLLIACRNLAKSINATGIAQLIQNKLALVDPATAEFKGSKIITSESIKDVFEEICKYEWSGEFQPKIGIKQVKRQVNRLKPIYDFFSDQIKNFDQPQLSNFLRTLYGSYVVKIEIQDEMEAFSIFERTNARGVDLEASDLLKNYLFAKGVDDLEETWSQIVENSDGTLLRMLKYFYVSKNGYIQKSNLYKELRRYGNQQGANSLVQELDNFSKFFNSIKNGNSLVIKNYFESINCDLLTRDQNKYERIHIALEGLRLFKITQMYPVIYAAIQCFVRTGANTNMEQSKELVSLFELMEKYHFINNAVCERIGNEVEKLYADFCSDYEKSKDFSLTTKDLISALKRKLATKEEFNSRFTEIYYSASSIPLIAYIFDRINNLGLDPGQRVNIFNPDEKLLRRNHNIEHFYPRNPEKTNTENKETLESVDNIGNLLAISFRTNSKLGNQLPPAKIEKLKNGLEKDIQNLSYVKEFISEYGTEAGKWDKTLINHRANQLAKEAYSKVWKI
jgi:uncharacterized protein with ParB-like and HNH nuclease domain